MKHLLKGLVLITLIALQFSFIIPSGNVQDCMMAHNGTFTYTDDDGDEVIVKIENSNYTEYHKNSKYTVERKLEWVDDCQFNAPLIKSTLPNTGKTINATLNFKIERIEGNYVYYTATLKGSYKGVLKKEGDAGSYAK